MLELSNSLAEKVPLLPRGKLVVGSTMVNLRQSHCEFDRCSDLQSVQSLQGW